jgi:putative nucleotidyltransferase with HDIG domain
MKSTLKIFGLSRIASRIVFVFICCAMIPIGALSFFSYQNVTEQLYLQGQSRLQKAVKAFGMSLYERLLFIETDMRTIASFVNENQDAGSQIQMPAYKEHMKQRLKAVMLVSETGTKSMLFGTLENPPEPTFENCHNIRTGKTNIIKNSSSQKPRRIFMMRFLNTENPEAGWLLGEIQTEYLWGIGHFGSLPPLVDLTVLGHDKNVIVSSIQNPKNLIAKARHRIRRSSPAHFEWTSNGQVFLSNSWSLFLKPVFIIPEWTVIMSQSKSNMFDPILKFKQTFLLIVCMSILMVVFLSIVYIRKTLVPIQELKEATIRLADGDFHSKVNITSGDEVEELAKSFNSMASQLSIQFNTLKTINDISNTILSSLITDEIIDTVLNRIHDVFICDKVIVSIVNPRKKYSLQTHVEDNSKQSKKRIETSELVSEDYQLLFDNPGYLIFYVENETPNFIQGFLEDNITSFVVFPLSTEKALSGIITIGYSNRDHVNIGEILQYRQIADQVAVALSNARLIQELNELNVGTLTALARAVDAKSPWTGGHSERVTTLAMEIGKFLALDEEELAVLQRAALLHDIGKIGIPLKTLDKQEKLSDEEFRNIQTHTQKSARILEPIAAYSEVIPIVLQHHERYDGKGYPYGLSGETITLGARIISVCDVFDAMVSDRPYRKAWDREKVIEMIQEGSGTQFDPNIVDIFLKIIKSK